MKERNHCRLCIGGLKTVYELTSTPLANSFPENPDKHAHKYPLVLKKCTQCEHVQLAHVPDAYDLYSQYKYATPYTQKPALEKRAKELKKTYPMAQNVCEIGANNGLFTWALRDAGFMTVGIDPTPQDGSLWKGFFDFDNAWKMRKRFGQFDLILGNNVFAHVDDLDSLIGAALSLLKPDGHLIFEVQYLPDLLANGYFDMVYHEHHDYHHITPLITYFDNIGFGVDYEHIPNHGGSIRITIRRGRTVDEPHETLPWNLFHHKINQAKMHTANIEGSIAAFGATAKACTLIHHLNLQDRIDYIVDETPKKIGKYIPGTDIQIVSPERLYNQPPDNLLLTAWNYADVLKKRFNEFNVVTPFENLGSDSDKMAS